MHIFFVFLFGSIIGSFLNVVILRLHTGRSLNGRSHCMSCGTQLPTRDLFPLISYLALQGRCFLCTSRISSRYFLVEALTGALFALIALQFFTTPFLWALFSIVAAILVVVFVYDLRHTIIPNELTIMLTVCAGAYISYQYMQGVRSELAYSVAAALSASLIFASLWFFSKGRWIGLGDAKLMFPLALFLGTSGALSFIVLAFWIGTVYVGVIALTQTLAKRLIHNHFSLPQYTMRSEVPFGPFLIAGFLIVLLGHVDILILIQSFADATTRLVYGFMLR